MLLFFVGQQAGIKNFPALKGTQSLLQRVHYNVTRVIIYAKYRTGSTYTSEFFVKHDESFFMFEPLMPRADTEKTFTVPIDVLRDLFQCKIINSIHRKMINNAWLEFNTFCHPDANQPACDKSKSHAQSLSKAESVCKGAKFKIIKVIRVDHLRDLAKFMAEGVKVIHLIRDPRGYISSQDHLLRGSNRHKRENYQERAVNFCQTELNDLNFISNFAHKENYHLVRYEDLAFFPMEEGHLLYDYLDIAPTRNLTDWMEYIEIGNKSPWKVRQLHKGDAFSTNRMNSAYTSQSWREQITKRKLYAVQYLCRDFMAKTGYIPVEFRNIRNYSIPALRSINPDRIRKYTPTD